MTELWRPVVGYENFYEISTTGLIRNLKTGIVRKVRKDRAGYARVNLSMPGGHHSTHRIHSLVALTFLGPRPEGMHACHNDGNKDNNVLENIRYDTVSENILDKVRHGTHHEKNKTRCPKGHEYSDTNTYYRTNGSRQCRVCDRERQRDKRNRT